MIHAVGIDSSLSETGVVVIRGVDGRPIFDSATAPAPPKNPNAEQELDRLRLMGSRVFTRATRGIETGDYCVFAIEGPSMGGIQGKPDERAGLRWMILNSLRKWGSVVIVPPSTIKKYWTGNGNAKKEVMVEFAHRRYPEYPNLTDDNVVDAFAIAHLVSMRYELITEPRAPGVDLRVLDTIRWPK